ncbi:hypothetical protein [Trueperella pyogenes]
MTVTKLQINIGTLCDMVRPAIEGHTARIAATAGDGYVGDVITSRGKIPRPHGAVRATTWKARRDNAKNNTLLKAVHG